jgi:tripartite-type tricarboxylate transporter receptor subunit TctC
MICGDDLKMIKKTALTFVYLICSFLIVGSCTAQEFWPSKPITYVVPYPAGGTTDILARLIASRLADALKVSVVVVNKPGATGTIGSNFVAKAAPDGYTMLRTSTGPHAIYPALSARPVYDAVKDFEPVVLVGTIPSVLIVSAASSYRSLKDIIDAARLKPGQVKFASGGTGMILQMSGELLKQSTATDMTHVPYKGDVPAIQDVMAGHVDFMFVPITPVLQHIEAGKLRALGMATPKRIAELPNVPTVNEQGQSDFIAEQFQAVFLPAKTSPAIVQRLNTEINQILNQPDVKKQISQLGVTQIGGSSADLGKYQKSDIARWIKVGQTAQITLD